VGITPLMAILRSLTDRNWQGDIYFLYCAKSPRDIIFRQELEDLQRRFPNLHLLVTLTRTEGLEWAGRTGRITGELLNQTIPDLSSQPVFICGPAAMMEQTIQLLREQGVPAEQIRSEAFLAAKRSDSARPSPAEASPDASPATAGAASAELPIKPSGPPIVTFARSGKTALLSPGQTLLELAEQTGLNLPYECRSGICGQCKTKLLAGCVTMEVQDALDDTDKANHLILLCQAKATAPVTLEA
jgi:glycine betaine catabolism B